MSDTVMLIIIEVQLVIILLLGVLLFLNWKRKKKYASQLESILNQIMDEEETRKTSIQHYLTSHLKLNDQAALELCEDFVEAEKQFMYVFLEQQMKQGVIDGFYQNLCELLDNYLNHIPKPTSHNIEKEVSEPESHAFNIGDENNAETSAQTVPQSSTPEQSSDAQTSDDEVDWGDAFAESGDEMDEDAKQSFENESSASQADDSNTEVSTSSEEEDVDWGDAFAESGDEMDEDAKSSFENEQQK